MAELYKKLEAYSQSDFYPFHMPGHKRNKRSADAEFPFEMDITEIEGFDNLHHPEDVLLNVQKQAADLYGVQQSFFSVNGSTAGLLSAISAAVKKGGKLLVARNCHKSVYHAIYLREIEPIYLYPPMNADFGINGGILPHDVENILKTEKDIQAVLITSPTYDGVVSDVKQIANIAHAYGVPLIVDEAHGAHFRYHSYFPVSAVDLGADLVIQSLHKTLPSMTQTAVLHRCSDRVSEQSVARFMGMYQSSSPSYILMSSMDACLSKLKKDGEKMFSDYVHFLDETRKCLKQCQNLKLVPHSIMGENGIFDYDRSKILISTAGTCLNGSQLSEILRKKYHLEMEMAEDHYVTALTSVGDTKEGFLRLCLAIQEIDRELGEESAAESEKTKESDLCTACEIKKGIPIQKNQICIPLEQSMKIADALDAESFSYPIKDSAGQISAEFAYFYPPGIPILTPGERITEELLEKINHYLKQGFVLQGLADYTNQNILVVNNRDN